MRNSCTTKSVGQWFKRPLDHDIIVIAEITQNSLVIPKQIAPKLMFRLFPAENQQRDALKSEADSVAWNQRPFTVDTQNRHMLSSRVFRKRRAPSGFLSSWFPSESALRDSEGFPVDERSEQQGPRLRSNRGSLRLRFTASFRSESGVGDLFCYQRNSTHSMLGWLTNGNR